MDVFEDLEDKIGKKKAIAIIVIGTIVTFLFLMYSEKTGMEVRLETKMGKCVRLCSEQYSTNSPMVKDTCDYICNQRYYVGGDKALDNLIKEYES